MAIMLSYDQIEKEAASLSRRHPEFRLSPLHSGPVRLCAYVEGHAVARRPGAAMFVIGAKEFRSWPECDKDGQLLADDGTPV